ncbi:S-adenosyl-L-methionine-dependent methyltransferase [Schizophyllum fasciatum]
MSQPARTAEEANKAHYDENAASYENIPDVLKLGSLVGAEFRRIVQPSPEKTRVLEYACGTGVVSREIAPFAKSVLGADISQGMVDQYNKRGTETMRAVCVQQGTPLSAQLDNATFDAIVCSMAYHHFADPAAVTRTLSELLAPRGTLVVVDRNQFGGEGMTALAAKAMRAATPPAHKGPHPHGGGLEAAPDDTVPHQHGFSEAQMREYLQAGGLVDCGFDIFKANIFGQEVEMFAAHGKKPEGAVL